MSSDGLFDLHAHGGDVFVGNGPSYPWGGLYGGQIVAQALRAAAATVDDGLMVHSLRAYFIRRGEQTEPIRFEVDRIRNGTSFCTRRVVARQTVGVILNLEASFQVPEESADAQNISIDRSLPSPDELIDDTWSAVFERRKVPPATMAALAAPAPNDAGRTAVWMRTTDPLPDDELLHRCWVAYMSDDIPLDSIRSGHPEFRDPATDELSYWASLDHTMWFHRPVRADQWHLYDMATPTFSGARGLAIGHVFALDGTLVATVAQEGIVRWRLRPESAKRQD